MSDSTVKCNTALETLTKVCEIYGLRLITETPPHNIEVICWYDIGAVVVSPTASNAALSNAADSIIENLRVKEGAAI